MVNNILLNILKCFTKLIKYYIKVVFFKNRMVNNILLGILKCFTKLIKYYIKVVFFKKVLKFLVFHKIPLLRRFLDFQNIPFGIPFKKPNMYIIFLYVCK